MYADVGPVRPVARPRSPVAAPAAEPARRVVIRDLGDTEILADVQEQVERLTRGLWMYRLTSYLYSCSDTPSACLDDGLVSCA